MMWCRRRVSRPPVFTEVALGVGVLSVWSGYDVGVAVASCWYWGILVSFTMAQVWDSSCYRRMREKNGWSRLEFHGGNVLLHVCPVVWTCYHPYPMHLTHGVVASSLFLSWCLLRGGLRFDLSHVYVPLPSLVWKTLILVNVGVQLLVAMTWKQIRSFLV